MTGVWKRSVSGPRGAAGVMAAALAIALAADPAEAQQPAAGWWDWALPAVLDGTPLRTARGDIRLPRGRDRDAEPGRAGGQRTGGPPGRAARRGGGPPFCRDGRGHPVHGTDWCRDKGWDDDGRLWQRASWPEVIFKEPSREDRALDRGGLIDVLGDIVLGRVDERSRYLGLTDALAGRWVKTPDGGSVLQVKSGGVPVAELTDADGDGRVDGAILLEAL